jgi:hypothetical protein
VTNLLQSEEMARSVAAQQLQLETVVPEPRPAREESHSQPTDEREASTSNGTGPGRAAHRPSPAALVKTPGALLTRSDLRGLGLERRAIDAVFRALPVVALPGYSRPMIRAEQYLELVEEHTYRDDRVRSCRA